VKFDDHELAHYLAEETGKRLLAVRERLYNDGASTWLAKDVGDAAAQRFLDEAFAEHRPTDAILSEEAADDSNRLTADRVWIIDPLDGTQEYSEFDRADWAVHIALWERKDASGAPSNDGMLTAGAVALPAFGLTLSTADPPAPPPRHEGKPRLVVSRNRATDAAIIVAQALDCEVAVLVRPVQRQWPSCLEKPTFMCTRVECTNGTLLRQWWLLKQQDFLQAEPMDRHSYITCVTLGSPTSSSANNIWHTKL